MNPAVAMAGGGLAGWTYLKATAERQIETLSGNALVSRNLDYFREKIASVRSADELVGDRRLLNVALTAFGLQDDIPNKFFIKKVLAEGTVDEKAFANRLSDRRYRDLASAFAFDLTPPNTVLSTFPDRIASRYLRQTFEVAAGDLDPDMRLALSFEREMPELAKSLGSDEAFWFTVIGTPPLRRVFESALGIPVALSGLDVDRQLELFMEKSRARYGTSSREELADKGTDPIVRDFLLRSQATAFTGAAIRGTVALSLLRSVPPLI